MGTGYMIINVLHTPSTSSCSTILLHFISNLPSQRVSPQIQYSTVIGLKMVLNTKLSTKNAPRNLILPGMFIGVMVWDKEVDYVNEFLGFLLVLFVKNSLGSDEGKTV